MAIATKYLAIRNYIVPTSNNMMRFPTPTLVGTATVFPNKLFVTPHVKVFMVYPPTFTGAA
jgi:hypothetical protein